MIKLAIFDLGNVLFKIDFSKTINFWVNKSDVDDKTIRSKIIESTLYEKFERGEVEPGYFFNRLREHLTLNIPIKKIVAGWNSLYGGIIHSNYEVIKEVAKHTRVVALTNTNCTHHSVWKKLYNKELALFEKIYVSSELGMRKPEKRIYRHVITDCGTSAEKAIFFDDLESNIKAAQDIGIKSVHITGSNTLQNWLVKQRGNID